LSATERQQRAEQGARAELGLAPATPLEAAEASVALKCALNDENWSAPPAQRLDMLCTQWDFSHIVDGDLLRYALVHSADYRRRLRELAAEALMSQRLAPELCISPHPLSHVQLQALLPGAHNHAVLFAAAQFFTHEFYPLAVDAFSFDSERQGRPFFNILGIHLDWLDPTGHAHRAIALDTEHNRLLEMPLDPTLPIHSAHFLSLGSDESALHNEWSTRLAMPQVNPAAAAALADDKCATAQVWSHAGLPVPPFISVEPRDIETATHFITTYGEAVIKPNAESEGRGVAYLQSPVDFAAYWRANHAEQNALLQARRDRVFFREPQTEAIHTLALRLNVGCDGIRWRVQSGYAQIGAHANSPASRGRGGAIIALAQLEHNLVYQNKGHWQPLCLDQNFWHETITRAESAAAAFANLLLVGLDLVIDLGDDGQPSALLLEANPRPAGLCHARLLRDGQAGVGAAMWNGLYAQLEQTATAVL
jgi:hypothetical protein